MKTPQEIFDIVATHLLKQNRRAKDGFSCRYRGDEGTKCAVGCLIDDQHYNVDMEGCSITEVKDLLNRSSIVVVEDVDYMDLSAQLIVVGLKASGVDCEAPSVLNLLDVLQNCHDNEKPENWRTELETIARNKHLNFNVQA